MLSVSPAVKIFLCINPTDLRGGFDRLAVLVEQALGKDPLSGHLFLFLNDILTLVESVLMAPMRRERDEVNMNWASGSGRKSDYDCARPQKNRSDQIWSRPRKLEASFSPP